MAPALPLPRRRGQDAKPARENVPNSHPNIRLFDAGTAKLEASACRIRGVPFGARCAFTFVWCVVASMLLVRREETLELEHAGTSLMASRTVCVGNPGHDRRGDQLPARRHSGETALDPVANGQYFWDHGLRRSAKAGRSAASMPQFGRTHARRFPCSRLFVHGL